jgi:hypothetical protein
MEQDLIAKGIISAVFRWTERSKNWYYAHGGRLNPDDGTLECPPTLREKELELMNKIEDVKAGRLKVDREMDELTMALGNPEHPGSCRGYGVVLWKYAFKGNLDSYKSRKRRKEREEEHWRQMMEQRLKEQDEKMQVEIEQRLAITISQIAQTEHCLKYLWIPSLALPLGKAVLLLQRLHQVLAQRSHRVLAQKALKSRGQSKEFQWMTTNNTRWIFSVDAPNVSCTSHSATSQCRWRTEVLLRIFLDRLATTCRFLWRRFVSHNLKI